ncbi:hypothetical protein JCM19274_2289 [Algibacter lectus]|uniref:Uncharacterized protein n=2 Tax=Algibacter lectus TaxID=221126 RepID=A0A090WZP0_9FLAO|nr:hypothetical protein JCM19274_2289 [Algibacter lectus]
MEPGKQRGKPVKVAYAVPIFFKYEANNKSHQVIVKQSKIFFRLLFFVNYNSA